MNTDTISEKGPLNLLTAPKPFKKQGWVTNSKKVKTAKQIQTMEAFQSSPDTPTCK